MRGLTTAAGVWISVAIGMACGVGFSTLALAGSALVLIALLVFRHIRAALLAAVQNRCASAHTKRGLELTA